MLIEDDDVAKLAQGMSGRRFYGGNDADVARMDGGRASDHDSTFNDTVLAILLVVHLNEDLVLAEIVELVDNTNEGTAINRDSCFTLEIA